MDNLHKTLAFYSMWHKGVFITFIYVIWIKNEYPAPGHGTPTTEPKET